MTTFPHMAAMEEAISTNTRQELMDESATPPTKE
jgi:hypothetical protein